MKYVLNLVKIYDNFMSGIPSRFLYNSFEKESIEKGRYDSHRALLVSERTLELVPTSLHRIFSLRS